MQNSTMESSISTQKTLSLLRDKLSKLELETQKLAENLQKSELENENDSIDLGDVTKQSDDVSKDAGDAQLNDSTNSQNSSTSVAETNSFISRICRNESQLQSIKDMIALLNQKQKKQKNQGDYEQKIVQVKQEFSKQLDTVKRDLQKSKSDISQRDSETRSLRKNVSSLEKMVENLQAKEAVGQGVIEGLTMTNTKLEKRVQKLREEVSYEQSMRATMEQSQITLLEQIRETEAAVEVEKQEVRSLTSACETIRAEATLNLQELKTEREARVMAEKEMSTIKSLMADKASEVTQGQESVAAAESQMKRLQTQYTTLNDQLVDMERITSQHVDVNKELRSKNKKLKDALIKSALQNDEITHTPDKQEPKEEEIKHMKQELQLLKDELKTTKYEKHDEITRLQSELKSTQRQQEITLKEATNERQKLETKVKHLENESRRAQNENETLIAEYKNKVTEINEEKMILDSDLKMVRLDLCMATESRSQLENEVTGLTHKIGSLEQQQASHSNVEATIHDMVKHKNQLAYDKGQLQTRILELERSIQIGDSNRHELDQTKKTVSILESKLKTTQSEHGSTQLEVKRLEGSISQLKVALNKKSDDLDLLQQIHDDVMSQNLLLKDKLESMQIQENGKEHALETNLNFVQEEKARVEGTLETMMSSHSQLQVTVATLEEDLGRRDSLITQLKHDKADLMTASELSQQEVADLTNKIEELESMENGEVKSLRNTLKLCRHDNKKMASALEELLQSNSGLQSSLKSLQNDLTKKNKTIEKMKQSKLKFGEEMKADFDSYDARITILQQDLVTERDKSDKKSSRECSELRKQIESLSSKNGELSRSNLDLRNRLSDLETTLKEGKDRNSSLKAQLDRVTSSKKRLEDNLSLMKNVKLSIDDLEATKEQYMKKNEQQGTAITHLMAKISGLHADVQSLSTQQSQSQILVNEKDREIQQTKFAHQQLISQYQERCDAQNQAEKRLHEVSNESLEISRHLAEAQNWFKSRFTNFEDHLKRSQQKQEVLEKENEENLHKLNEAKSQAKLSTTMAKKIVKASRMTMEQLADYAATTDEKAQSSVKLLYRELEKEKDHSKLLEIRNSRLQASSGRQLEALAKELSNSYLS